VVLATGEAGAGVSDDGAAGWVTVTVTVGLACVAGNAPAGPQAATPASSPDAAMTSSEDRVRSIVDSLRLMVR
jgi:hypothetical protein